MTGLEPATAWSQTRNATNCATPRLFVLTIFLFLQLLLCLFLDCGCKGTDFFCFCKTFQEKSIKLHALFLIVYRDFPKNTISTLLNIVLPYPYCNCLINIRAGKGMDYRRMVVCHIPFVGLQALLLYYPHTSERLSMYFSISFL